MAPSARFALSPASRRASACHSGTPDQQQTRNILSVIFSPNQLIIFPSRHSGAPGNEHPSAALIHDYGVIDRDAAGGRMVSVDTAGLRGRAVLPS